MENFEQKAQEYLENKHRQQSKHLGDSLEERKKRYFEALAILQQPFSDYEFQEEGSLSLELKGSEEYENESTKIFLEYNSEKNTKAIFGLEEDVEKFIRKIKKLHIESRRFVFDMDQVPVPKYGIFFKTDRVKSKPGEITAIGGYSHMAQEINIESSIITPAGMLTLFHELGHFWRAERLGDSLSHLYGKHKSKDGKLSGVEKALILEEERSADAAALIEVIEFLKPVVDPSVIRGYINGSLLIYSGMLRVKK